ncbi:DUF6305 family protein [Bacillaceae bacterium S4-13-56]
MRKFFMSYGVILILFSIGVFLMFWHSEKPKEQMMYTWPNLPAPIGHERVLLTLAGQPSEGRIIDELARQLHLDADYRPMVLGTDVYDYRTIVVAVGYSPLGVYDSGRTLQEEKDRIQGILKEVRFREIPLIMIHLDGAGRLDPQTMEFMKMIAPYTSYFLGLKSMENQMELQKIFSEYRVPITLVNSVNDFATPFNSAFR